MKIGVNLFPLRPQTAGGHEIYVRNLLRAMFQQAPDHSYFIITAPWNHQELDYGDGPYRKICIETGPPFGILRRLRARLTNSPWGLYRCAIELGVDVWFCPMMDLTPRNIDIPSVVTVPDIQQEFYPQFFSPEELLHRQLTVRPSCQLAGAVITVSEFSGKALMDRYNLDPDKVHVVYEAAGPEFNPSNAEESWPRVQKEYGLQEGYLFYPANTWVHKNHEVLLMALHRLKRRGLTPQLVLTGATIRPLDSLKALARQLDCENQILHLGYVDQRFFPGLYRGAACLVFPSLFEGFGIPLVEAMATGCAIACGDVCSIPEVVGEAAMVFDPRNPDSIADTIEPILLDPEVGAQLVKKGWSRATLFSWEKAARETLEVLEAAPQPGAPSQGVKTLV
jgi:glycosyltransferase involved in cell wall biosynthesis